MTTLPLLPHPSRVGTGRRPTHPHPLPEAVERLGISRWQAHKPGPPGRLPTTRLGARDLHVPAAVLRRIGEEGLPGAGGR